MPKLSRRGLLRGLGGAGAVAALSPFVPLLQSRAAFDYPTRLIIFATNTGMTGRYPNNWKPNGTERGFTFPAGSILEPLDSYRDRMLILQGLDMQSYRDSIKAGGHPTGMVNMLTGIPPQDEPLFTGGAGGFSGWADGPSVDQVVADAFEGVVPFRSIEAGVAVRGDAHIRNRMVYRGPAQPVPPNNSPWNLFDRLFAGLGDESGERDRILADRASVLDAVRQDLSAVQARLGREDRDKIEAHLSALRTIESRLDLELPAACTAPELGAQLGGNALTREENIPTVAQNHYRVITSAMACDLTRVASIQFGSAPVGWRFPWLSTQLSDTMHSLSHAATGDAGAQDDLERAGRWFAGQFKMLLDMLDAVPEGDGTLLDHSVVLWCTENARSNNHDWRNMPYVIAGGACGRIDTGRFLDFGGGVPHNRMLTTLAHAMGVEVDTIGGAAYGTGVLPGVLNDV